MQAGGSTIMAKPQPVQRHHPQRQVAKTKTWNGHNKNGSRNSGNGNGNAGQSQPIKFSFEN
jgi:hypothetical protein